MKKSGNGRPEQCVANLVQMVRGECPYDRIKGLDPNIIGMPYNDVKSQIKCDIKWLVRTYEPRAEIDEVEMEELIANSGRFGLNIAASVQEV